MTGNSVAVCSGAAVRAALARGVQRLAAGNVASAALSAELLLLHVVGRERAWLYAHPEYVLTASEEKAYEEFLTRRASGEPTQYITGRQEFWGLAFEVTPSVLIPRPETEHVIEVALARLAERAATGAATGSLTDSELDIADVGTGSGCIAVALAKELPRAQFLATDISADALEVARRNAVRHGVSDRVRLSHADLLEGASSGLAGLQEHEDHAQTPQSGRQAGRFDLIVSNPPYIAQRESHTLPVDVREHEPHQALFGGATGVEIYPRLIAHAGAALRPGGVLVLELGYDSAERVRAMFCRPQVSQADAAEVGIRRAFDGWRDLRITNDLAGIPRVISAIRV